MWNYKKEWTFNSDIKCWMKNFWKNYIFTSFFFETLKFCKFWYYTISQHCWPFCWKMLTFTFSNIQLPNIILFAWLNVKNIILGVVESTVLFKIKVIFKKWNISKTSFFEKNFFYQEYPDWSILIFYQCFCYENVRSN